MHRSARHTAPGEEGALPRPDAARWAVGRALDAALDRTVAPGYTRVGLAVRRHLPTWPADPAPGSLEGRSALVTGATSGLGTATARGLARLGAQVHLVVRDEDKGERVRAQLLKAVPGARLDVWRCDVADLDDVRRFAAALTERLRADASSLDVMVHNAGVMPPERSTSPQGHELSLATHVLGPVAMTEALRPVLARSGQERDWARVVLVSSGGMYAQPLPVDDPEYSRDEYRPAAAYARTKRIQVELLPVLARRWAGERIAVQAMHPGWADTPGVASSLPGFYRVTRPFLRSPDEGADTAVWLAAAHPPPLTGQFWHDRAARPTSLLRRTRTTDLDRARLWQWCAGQLGLQP
ncbi:MAG TPA: SDR family NAD(P)-dependent oxidoreductase [Nocardioidaceae bacterium]|nr:SDR family NAD(P)-dependent oxidoreductase [Nocardioidaceae bacterium]